MRKSLLLLIALAAPVAGCSATTPDPFLTASVRPDAPPISSEVAPEFAVALLPVTGGRIKSVRQTARKDYLQQQIVYENASESFGENGITVEIGKPSLDVSLLRSPSKRQIISEMRQAFPGVGMAIQPSAEENLQGVYGYATGKFASGGSCIYGWQMVNPNANRNPVALMAGIDRKYRMQIRMRYCHPGIPEERIKALMDGLRVKPVSSETMNMLQFASGSGQVAVAPPVAEPVVEQPRPQKPRSRTARVTDDVGDINDVVLPITRRQPYPGSQQIMVNAANPMPVTQAARVPLPVAGPVTSPVPGNVDPTVTAAPVSRVLPKAAAVPLPGVISQ